MQPFAKVPHAVVFSNISPGGKELYSFLVARAGKLGYCRWGLEALAKALGRAVRTIQRRLAEVVSAGLILVTRRGPRTNIYSLPGTMLEQLNLKLKAPAYDDKNVVIVTTPVSSQIASILTEKEAPGKEYLQETSSSSVEVCVDARASGERDDDDLFAYAGRWLRTYTQASGKDLGEPDRFVVGRILESLKGGGLGALHALLYRLWYRRVAPGRSYGWFITVIQHELGEPPQLARASAAGGGA